MFVGIGRFVIQIPEAQSLKERRRVVKGAKERLRARLPISAAEVGDTERLQLATLAAVVVAKESSRCVEVLAQARAILASFGDAVLCDVASEVLSFQEGGLGLAGGIEKALDQATLEGSWAEFSAATSGQKRGKS